MKQLIQMTIEEASHLCGSSTEQIIHYIEEEWITPYKDDAFDDEDISRMKLIHDLVEEFGVNEESVPIILHLIDQIHWLKNGITTGGEVDLSSLSPSSPEERSAFQN